MELVSQAILMGFSKIFLITDFGVGDWYVPALKSSILDINADSQIIDATHDIPSFDIITTAFYLHQLERNINEPSIYLVVVDPGVGGQKHSRIIVENSKGNIFIGPDNGIFSMIYHNNPKVFNIDLEKLQTKLPSLDVSNTFHGRDIFGPTAALISKGVGISEITSPADYFFQENFYEVEQQNQTLIGKLIYIDKFGNVISNINREIFGKSFTSKQKVICTIGKNKKIACYNTYSDVNKSEFLALFGSSGYLEIAVNQGFAAELLSFELGEKIILSTS
ncbi:MAG: hypothetical protein COC01_04680 [Bacteroidetes bacterium]|nr:MAG: hypothetical protein COC01_04680 [Bacteroidota bacterium]